MNINEFKSAYDGVYATGDLKKRVMDGAEKGGRKRSAARKFLPVFGGLAGAAVVFAIIIFGAGWPDGKLNGEITAVDPEQPIVASGFSAAPKRSVIGEPVSPTQNASPEVYELMPDPDEILSEEERAAFYGVFKESFITFGQELIGYVGEERFSAWLESFKDAGGASGRTFYDSPTLLSYVVGMDMTEEDAAALFSAYYAHLYGRGFSEEEVRAIASRDESACAALFVSENTPLITKTAGGYTFYSLGDLYAMSPRELAALLADDPEAKTLEPLKKWAEETGNELYIAAVERKILLVKSYMLQADCPRLGENYRLSGYYDPKVCDLSENIEINGVTIFNYVRRLAERKISDANTLYSALYGAAAEPNGYTLPNYCRLVSEEQFNITPEELYEALSLIDLHYYGQTGEHLYKHVTLDDTSSLYPYERDGYLSGLDELELICYGRYADFSDKYVLPTVYRSNSNVIGGTLWINGESLYYGGAAGMLEYGDLRESNIEAVLAELSGEQAEWFSQQARLYFEIRRLTALYLDGGAFKADEELLGEAPELSSAARERMSGTVRSAEPAGCEKTELNALEMYRLPISELAKLGVSAEALMNEALWWKLELTAENGCADFFLRKAFLYAWHVGYADLYSDLYIGALLGDTDHDYKTSGGWVYVKPSDEQIREKLRVWHIGYFADGLRELYDDGHDEPEDHITAGTDGEEINTGEVREGIVYDNGDESLPDMRPSAKESTHRDIGEYFLKTGVNPILPEAGDRGLFLCSGWGYDKWLDITHYGIDFAPREGDVIAAFDGGTVSFAGERKDAGLCVIIDHENGMQSVYSHCRALYVSEGQTAEKGGLIGEVGSSGVSVGPHLHFELKKDGENVDPKPYLE